MEKGIATRSKLLNDAFKLFSEKSYEKVSFSELEKSSHISRGSMVYYFKNKEGLFLEMLKTMIFNKSSVRSVPTAYRQSLLSFYNYFIEMIERDRQSLNDMGIININKATCNIEMSALSNIPSFKDEALKWYDIENNIWCEVIRHAIEIKEISTSANASVLAHLFEKIYLGNSFIGVFSLSGIDLREMKKDFDYLYELIKL